ncbi:ribonuclease III [Fusibacter sp. 3D3]|uniref:ribonuclease III n=1 Tax=Fusibacter sp. 3D3 TaxID=1048380 RepID=UPI0008535EDC|nr:ribonuclease III [Fusibacter sp. 3D3]GAU78769.1 ribonuclease III [Fusibacter sp. 3D3]
MASIKDLEKQIRYEFKDIAYLRRAITHSSYANENKKERIKNNERLEFLGDSVLGLVISEYLYSHFPNLAEGQLTKVRARIVCEASLGEAARLLEIGTFMMFGRGEELTGGRERTSILSDAFEALVAALYLDGGVDVVRTFVLEHMEPIISEAVQGKMFVDYKTRLQEVIQIKKGNRIKYEIFKEEGPDHSKLFYTHVKLNDQIIGVGNGRSKKESEQEAAKEGLKKLASDAS